MRTRQDWPRTDFFDWFDDVRKRLRPDLPHDYALAEAAGMSHSTISSWRSGRQRPTTAKLSDVAQVLDLDPRHLWVHAGLMSAEEVGLDPSAEPGPLLDADEATRQMIEGSNLSPEKKAELLAMLDEEARDDAAQRQRRYQRLLARDLQEQTGSDYGLVAP
jgi:transcriptional regulator with XRE-family HTH domain